MAALYCILLGVIITEVSSVVYIPDFKPQAYEALYHVMMASPPADPQSAQLDPQQVGVGRARPGVATNTHSCNRVRAVPSRLRSATHMRPSGLGNFYQKYTEAYGIPILGSANLPHSALKRACYIVRFLFADRYDVRNWYYKNHGRFALMGVREVTTSIPEHARLGAWWNSRARGLGATISAPVSTGAEENVLCRRSGDRYRNEDIALHEFSHGLHLLGAKYAIRGFENKLYSLYNSARRSGKWARTYSLSTKEEYWAEGVQSYFEVNAFSNPPNGIHGPINTRALLKNYDRELYNLIEQAFPCGNNYIKRCGASRAREGAQVLRMNCNKGGKVFTTKEPTTTRRTTELPGTPPPPGVCTNKHTRCDQWEQAGWCQRSKWMRTNCMKACKECGILLTTLPTTTIPITGPTCITTTRATVPSTKKPNCPDYNKHCADWSRRGECQRNPRYMLVYCKRSCNRC